MSYSTTAALPYLSISASAASYTEVMSSLVIGFSLAFKLYKANLSRVKSRRFAKGVLYIVSHNKMFDARVHWVLVCLSKCSIA